VDKTTKELGTMNMTVGSVKTAVNETKEGLGSLKTTIDKTTNELGH
jgi:hypothetical protein